MKPFEIIVGRGQQYDPAPGDTDCPLPFLKGLSVWIEKTGYGPYTFANYGPLSGGGFRLLNGIEFVDGESFYVHVEGLAIGEASTNYTNGFNYSSVISALFGRVGWKSATLPSVSLSEENALSKSGRYFNDYSFHSLVTLNNVYQTMEDPAANQNAFNGYLEMLQKSVILRALNAVFNPIEYITQGLLFERWATGVNDQPIANTGKFVGLRIKVPPATDLATQVDSVSLYFDSDVTFNLYLFQDTKKAPLWFGEVNAVANTETVVTLPDIVLNYISEINHGGIFYLGYFQSDIGSAKAIKQNNVTFKCNAPYAASFVEATQTDTTDFDRNNISYSTYEQYGLNFHISVFRDHTWQITKKPALFDNLIGLQMAAQVVENILNSTRSNSTERILKDDIAVAGAQMDLNGVAAISDSPHSTGLRKQIAQELQRVKDGFFPRPKAQTVNLC